VLFTWKTTLLFVICATLLLLQINWLMLGDTLPIKKAMDYSTSETNFLKLWIKIAVVIGVLLPGVAFFVWHRYPEPRKIMEFYLVVLIVQIVTESILSRVLFPSLVVITGTIYTVFRICQLWQGQQLVMAAAQINNHNLIIFSSLLWLLLLFWSSNLIVIFAVSWPNILSKRFFNKKKMSFLFSRLCSVFEL
jgi:hypothetical protein